MSSTLAAGAAALLRAGRTEEAISAYQTLLQADPADADAWYNLAYLMRQSGRYEDALVAYQRAIDRGMRAPEEAHVNRAAILSEHLARTDEAVAELRVALTLEPGFFHALFDLANLHEDRGEPALARTRYEEALAAEPGSAVVLARLAMLDVHEGNATRARHQLAAALERRRWAPADEAELRFAHARALDREGDVPAAFATLARANELSRGIMRAHRLGYDRAAHTALVDALIDAFPLAAVLPTPSQAEAAAAPIFVCGLYRSGSTLTEQVLAAHHSLTAGGELEILPRLILERLQPYPAALTRYDTAALSALRSQYLEQIAERFPAANRVTDKRPDNFLHIGLIKSIMPEARIVHTLRDVADNLLSLFMLNFDHSVSYSFDLDDIAHWIGEYRRLMAHWEALWPGDIHGLDYDALVADPDPNIRALLAFCDLPFDPACLEPHRVRNVVRTASYLQVREPLHRRASNRAARYAPFLADVVSRIR